MATKNMPFIDDFRDFMDLPDYMFDFRVQMDMELSDKCPAFMPCRG